MTLQRLSKLGELQREAGTDYVAVVPGPNLLYFTGLHMHLSERPIVALFPANPNQQPILISPFFEVGKAANGPVTLDWKIHSYKDGVPYQDAFDEAARANKLDGCTIGVEPTQMRVLEWNLLSRSVKMLRQADGSNLIKQLRMTKDADEIAKMKRAVVLTERALDATLPHIKAGQTEREVAARLSDALMQQGADQVAFMLVQTGLSATNPHGSAGGRVLQNGDLMVMDFGLTLDEYTAISPAPFQSANHFALPVAPGRRPAYKRRKQADTSRKTPAK